MPETRKRLSLDRRVDLIFAFYRDQANRKSTSKKDMEESIALLRREIRRQIEHAIRDDREMREPSIQIIKELVGAIEAAIADLGREGTPIELTDEELCPACGVPYTLHGTVHSKRWFTFVCAGISGRKLFVSPDIAAGIVDLLEEKKDERGESGDGTGGDAAVGDGNVSLSG